MAIERLREVNANAGVCGVLHGVGQSDRDPAVVSAVAVEAAVLVLSNPALFGRAAMNPNRVLKYQDKPHNMGKWSLASKLASAELFIQRYFTGS